MKLGVIGSGQLGVMIANAAWQLGVECSIFGDDKVAPASRFAGYKVNSYTPEAVNKFAESVDVVTFEFEHVLTEVLQSLQDNFAAKCSPTPHALLVCQDRLLEKQFLASLGIPVAPFVEVDDLNSLRDALIAVGGNGILKTRVDGYDGKGQIRVSVTELVNNDAITQQCFNIVRKGRCIVEKVIDFDEEVSMIAACGRSDDAIVTYPLVRNVHKSGILRESTPAPELNQLAATATEYLSKIQRSLNYVGVLTVEFFVKDGTLIANEIAPRVHNSGHWTIEGAVTSQFEQAVRTAVNLPLGSTAVIQFPWMANIIGTAPDMVELLKIPRTKVHLYGKSPRPDRKLGHISVLSDSDGERTALRSRVLQALR